MALSFKQNPAAYGCTGTVRPSFDTSRSARANELKKYTRKTGKKILPTAYDDSLNVQLRRIPGFEPDCSNPIEGEYPEYRDINPQTELFIDANYQAELRANALVQVEKIVKNFSFDAIKALTVYERAGGGYVATDGQKTGLAAIYRGLTRFPALVHRDPDGSGIVRQARSFLGVNSERRIVPAADILTALITSQNQQAVEFAELMREFKIQPRDRDSSTQRNLQPRETTCCSLFRDIHARAEPEHFKAMLQILSDARFAPIRREHIWAARAVVETLGAEKLDYDRMRNAIRSIGDKYAILEAKENARNALKKTTVANELAAIYIHRYKKRAIALDAK